MIELKEIKAIAALMSWREEVIRNVFDIQADPPLLEANREYYARHVADGSHVAFVATVDGVEAGCGAVCFAEELPSPDNPSGRNAYLMNIYVRESFRHEGVAHSIVSRLIEEATGRGCDKIYLETTPAARAVYASLNFHPMPDMMKYTPAIATDYSGRIID